MDHAQAREFTSELAAITFDPFPLRIVGLDTFGGNEPRAIWAGLDKSDALESLARANERAARNAGLKPEGRKFTPHITLARLNTPRIEPIARFMQRVGGVRSETFLVDHFVLYSSKPSTGGGPYVVEASYPSTLGEIDTDDEAGENWGNGEWDDGNWGKYTRNQNVDKNYG